MINGRIDINIRLTPPITWRECDPDEWGRTLVASLGDLTVCLRIHDYVTHGGDRVRNKHIDVTLGGITTLRSNGEPKHAIRHLKALCEQLLVGLQNLSPCPDGCHVPWGYLQFTNTRGVPRAHLRWEGWINRNHHKFGSVICGDFVLSREGITPLDTRTRPLPTLEVAP